MLINAEFRQDLNGFYLNDKFVSFAYKVRYFNTIAFLIGQDFQAGSMEVDLNTIVIKDIDNVDITPTSFDSKARVLNTVVNFAKPFTLEVNEAPVSTQNPIPTGAGRVFQSDLDFSRSDNFTFGTDVEDIAALFSGLHTALEDNTGNATKELLIHFNWAVFSNGIALECNELGDFSNVKVELLRGGGVTILVADNSADNTKLKSAFYSFANTFQPVLAFNAVKLTFSTADPVCLTNVSITKVSSAASTVLAVDTITNELGFIGKTGKFLDVFSKEKPYSYYVNKFGENPEIDTGTTPETIWDGSDLYEYTDRSNPVNYYISSDNVSDNQLVMVELITKIGTDYVRNILLITLQGQTPVLIQTPSDLTTIAINRASNMGNTVFLGNVYIYEDTPVVGGVPVDLSKVRALIRIGNNQTLQAVYTVPNLLENGVYVEVANLIYWEAKAIKNRAASGLVFLFVREENSVFRVKDNDGLSDATKSGKMFGDKAPLQVPVKSDIEIRVNEVSANDVAVSGGFQVELKPVE